MYVTPKMLSICASLAAKKATQDEHIRRAAQMQIDQSDALRAAIKAAIAPERSTIAVKR